MKRIWKTGLDQVQRITRHRYERNMVTGVENLTGMTSVVSVSLRVAGGPEDGRELIMDLMADEAEELAATLVEKARMCREWLDENQ
jgi:hypothetical protein